MLFKTFSYANSALCPRLKLSS